MMRNPFGRCCYSDFLFQPGANPMYVVLPQARSCWQTFLNACMLNLRNHSCKTSLKPDARPQEAETHSAISRWKHIVKATCSYGERKQTYVGKTRCHRPRRWSDDSSILRASHAGCRAALETSTWPGTST